MKRAIVHLTVNGDRCSAVVSPSTTLAEMLRDELRLTGTKVGCGTGDCGACTVLLNGRSVNSCLTLALEADGAAVTTIEGSRPPARRCTRCRRPSCGTAPSSAVSARRA